MDKQSSLKVVGVLLVAIGSLLYVAYRSATLNYVSDGSGAVSTTTLEGVTVSSVPPGGQMMITVKHAFRNGEHLLVGDVLLPSRCHVLDATPAIAHNGLSATIHITRTYASSAPCPQIGEVSQRFRVNIVALPEATFSVTVDGIGAVLNVIEARADEDLDRLEIFFKG